MTIDNNMHAQLTPGVILKEARELKGLSQSDVAHRLNLRISLVREIELDRFDQKTASTFTRGYLKTYARFVGVDEELVLQAYDRLGVSSKSVTEMHSFSGRTHREANEYKLRFISWFIFIMLAAAGATWWWFQPVEEPVQTKINEAGVLVSPNTDTSVKPTDSNVQVTPDKLTPKSENESTVSSSVIEKEDEEISTDSDGTDEQNHSVLSNEAEKQDDSRDTQVITADKAESAPTNISTENKKNDDEKVGSAASDVTSTGTLQLKFSSSCWLKIVDAKGKSLFEGTKTAGDFLDLSGEEPINLIIGAPRAVDVTFHGQSIDMGQFIRRGVVARYQLPLKN